MAEKSYDYSKKLKDKTENKEESSKKEPESIDASNYYDKKENVGDFGLGGKEIPEDVKKEVERIQDNLKEFKKFILKKFPYILSIGILPPAASKIIEEEELVEKEKDEKLIHLIMIIPEENIKDILKLRQESINLVKSLKPKVWIHIKTSKQLWEICFNSKYSLIEAISMSFPLHDKNVLGALRVASIHKMLVLRKFERYVVSYVLAGSLVRGQISETSDVDVYIIIDDTDVKRMSRFELKEKLRAITYSYAIEASEIAGVKNKLSPQIYILTEFWEAVKDAHPVIFTFIRDGVPLYDRGAFMPWKMLLKMGKIKPSPEAIDMFMSLGERVAVNVERKLNEIATEDIYWGVITPSQAVLMLYGIAPPTPLETVSLVREIFVEKEKLLESKYADILKSIVSLYKKYEHEEIKTISGKEIDVLVKQSSEYIKRLKELMVQIEKKMSEQDIVKAYDSVLNLIKNIIGNVNEANLLARFKSELIDKSKISSRNLSLLKELIEIKTKHKKGKITKQDLASSHKISHELTSALIEYSLRKELFDLEKRKIDIIYTEGEGDKKTSKKSELVIFKDVSFIIPDKASDKIKKFENNKIVETDMNELKAYLKKDEKAEKKINSELLSALKKMFDEFTLVF